MKIIGIRFCITGGKFYFPFREKQNLRINYRSVKKH